MSDSEPRDTPHDVQRTDFVSIPVADMERAKAFYRETLGMHSPDWDASWPELETGNISLYLVDPTAMGTPFTPHTAPLALRVADVADARSVQRPRARHTPRRLHEPRISAHP